MQHLKASRLALAPTPNFVFQSDGSSVGDAAVAAMQAVCEADYAAVKAIFGGRDVPGRPFHVIVDPSAGGAYHQTCADTIIHLIPDDAATLLVAEHVECFEAMTGTWDCGAGNGEGLSRVLAMAVRPPQVLGQLDGDIQGWWTGGRPIDYVTSDPVTDTDEQVNACSSLFLFYLRFQLNYSWAAIVAAGAASLGDTYAKLTGRTPAQGFSDFVTCLRQADSSGQLQVPSSGNPFPLGQPTPVPTPTPTPPTGKGCVLFGLLG